MVKTSRPVRYDLRQNHYYNAAEVTNGFKGLELVYSVSVERWTEVCNTVEEAVNKTIQMKKKSKKAKW